MRESPKMAGDTHAASLERRNANLPYIWQATANRWHRWCDARLTWYGGWYIRTFDLPYKSGSIVGIADAMRHTPDMAGDTHAASLERRNANLPYVASNMAGIAERCTNHLIWQVIHTQRHSRRNVDLPYMAGNMIDIADAMHESPDMAGDAFAASLTRRTVDLPYMAGSIKSIADVMRDSPDWKVNIRSVTHTTYGWSAYKAGSMIGIADAMRDSPDMAGEVFAASLTWRAADLPYNIRQVA
jgi:hypothetical protein